MTKITERNESSSLLTVDKALLESVLESHIKVLDTLRDWTNSDDFLWIQYSDEIMKNKALALRAALKEGNKVDFAKASHSGGACGTRHC